MNKNAFADRRRGARPQEHSACRAVPVPSAAAAGAPAGASAGAAKAERRMPNRASLRATPPSSRVVYRAGRQWHAVAAWCLLPWLLLDLRLNDEEEEGRPAAGQREAVLLVTAAMAWRTARVLGYKIGGGSRAVSWDILFRPPYVWRRAAGYLWSARSAGQWPG